MGKEYHARCWYCGWTESEKWVTAWRYYGPGKLYCSPECRRADELWSSLCFSIAMIALINLLWSVYGHLTFNPIPWYLFLLSFLLLCAVPVVMAIRGIIARIRISRRFRKETDW